MKQPLFTLAVLCVAMAARAATPAETLVTKARAALGGEAALNAVHALRFEVSAADAEGKSLGVIISEYKEPMKLREIDYTHEATEIVSAIDGAEGHRVMRRLDSGARRMEIMPTSEVDARRDFALSNLHLMAVPSPARGVVETEPGREIDGVKCDTLAYKYHSGIVLRRFVEAGTGRLVATRVDFNGKAGDLMVNKGEQIVSGIRFPKEIVILNAEGKTLRKLAISKIEVNPALDDKSFATPLF